MPIVPAIWEAEARELLDPKDRDCSELRLHLCTPASQSKTLSLTTTTKKVIEAKNVKRNN